MSAEAEERREEQRHARLPQANCAKGHDADLGNLDDAGNERFVDAVRERARRPGEEEERRNEDRAGQHHERRRAEARLLCQTERHDDAHRALQQVVVEGAQELGDEQRRESAGPQELDDWRSHGGSPTQTSRRPTPR
jgi:hypothetical protein